MRKLLLTIFILLNSVIGFSNDNNGELINALRNNDYRLVEITGITLSELKKETVNKLVISKNDSGINIFLGVNSLRTQINKSGKIFSPGPMTLMAGEKIFMQLENKSFKILDATENYVIDENKITFYNKDKTEKLVYEKVEVSLLEKALKTSTYNLKSYTKGKFQMIPKEMKNKIMIEDKNGQISGFAGVNRFFASYSSKTYLDKIGSTRIAGSETAMKFEVEYLKALSTIEKVTVKGNNLIIETENGKLAYKKM